MKAIELLRQSDYAIANDYELHDLPGHVVLLQGDGPEHWLVWTRSDFERLTEEELSGDPMWREEGMTTVWNGLWDADIADSPTGRKVLAAVAAIHAP